MSYLIFPRPQEIVIKKTVMEKPKTVYLHLDDIAEVILEGNRSYIEDLWGEHFPCTEDDDENGQALSVVYDEQARPQGYMLDLKASQWKLRFRDALGLYYGILTFCQIWEQSGNVNDYVNDKPLYVNDKPLAAMEEISIVDFPGTLNRGILLDISRDKIPSKETLLAVIDKLSLMRINELQLYIQGYPYEYAGYEHMFPDETPITREEMKQITEYAGSRFIRMIPNMNCLGHMDMWLEQMELQDLAECPDGFLFQDLYYRQPGTIDPSDEKAFDFITGLVDDLSGCFEVNMFNANLDEPYELGLGKSKSEAERAGVAGVYVDYVWKVNEYLNKKGYEMMIWGDVVFNHPEVISQLPENITLLDWIYEGSASFKDHAKRARQESFRYYVCPGTSSWCSLLGRSDNMKDNIRDAAEAAVTYHAHGILTTDWGDMGHWQYLPISYAGFAFTGGYGWNTQTEDEAVLSFLNRCVFKDGTNCFAQLLYKLGNYYLQEDVVLFNTTFCFANITSKYRFATFEEYGEKMKMLAVLTKHIAQENHIPYNGFQDNMKGEKVIAYVTEIFDLLEKISLLAEDGDLIKEEIGNSVRMVCHGAVLHQVMTQTYETDKKEAKRIFGELYNDMLDIRKKHYELWMKRNRKGGFSRSADQMLYLCEFYRKEMESL